MPRQLKNLRIDEVSSVDRGAGEGVRVLLMKREGKSAADVDAHSTAQTTSDNQKREAHAHKALELALGSIMGIRDHDSETVGKVVECFKQFHNFLNDDDQENAMSIEVSKEDLEAMLKGMVAGALKDAGVVKEDVKEDEIDKKKPPKAEADDNEPDADDDKEACDKLLTKVFGADGAKEIVAQMAKKAAPVEKRDDDEIRKRDAEIVDLRKHVQQLTDRQQREDFAKRAVDLGLPKDDGEKLRKAYSGDVTALQWMEDTIRKLHTQVEKAGLFSEIGDSRGGQTTTPHDELLNKAKEIQKSDPKLTEAQAYVRAMEVYPDIAKREAQERVNKIQKLA